MNRGTLSCAEHVERASQHQQVGEALGTAANNEWAGVCYFYSAYHLVVGSIYSDPIFGDLKTLKAIHHSLTPEDRYTTQHQARRGSEKPFGVNELVGLLYRPIREPYLELHGQSIDVRYYRSSTIDLTELLEDLANIDQYFRSGQCGRPTTMREQLLAHPTA